MKNSIQIKLSILYILIFMGFACYSPFLQVYYSYIGLSYTEIGMILALNSIVGFAFQPLWGYIIDNYTGKKRGLIICMFISLLSILTFVYAKNFRAVIMCTVLFIIFQSGISPVMDAYCYDVIDKYENIEYGKVRLMGSFGYALSTLFMGFLIAKTSIYLSFYVYSIVFIVATIVIKSFGFKGNARNNKVKFVGIESIIRNKNFILFIISTIFINIAIVANSSYLPVLLKQTGGNVSNLGVLWFILSVSEIPMLFIGNKILNKVGILHVYLLCIVLYIIRFTLDSICSSYIILIILQFTQAITYPVYLVASLEYINKIIPKEYKTLGITIFYSVGAGFGGFVGDLGFGVLLDRVNVFEGFRILAVSCGIALINSLLLEKIIPLKNCPYNWTYNNY